LRSLAQLVASSSRSQINGSSRWGKTVASLRVVSVHVRWRVFSSAAIVTQLVTHPVCDVFLSASFHTFDLLGQALEQPPLSVHVCRRLLPVDPIVTQLVTQPSGCSGGFMIASVSAGAIISDSCRWL